MRRIAVCLAALLVNCAPPSAATCPLVEAALATARGDAAEPTPEQMAQLTAMRWRDVREDECARSSITVDGDDEIITVDQVAIDDVSRIAGARWTRDNTLPMHGFRTVECLYGQSDGGWRPIACRVTVIAD